VRADRDTAGGHEQVVLEPPSNSLAMGFLGIGDRRQALGASARRGELRREDQPVGLVDLAGPEGLAGAAKLASRGENGGPRSGSTGDFGHAGRGERSELGGAKPCSSRHDAPAGANVSAARTNIRGRSNGFRNLDFVVMLDNILDGYDSIGAFGKRATGRYPHRLAGLKRFLGRPACGDALHHGQCPGRVRRAQGKSVHRGVRKRRQIDQRGGRLREHPPGGRFELDALGRQRSHPLENQALRLVDRQKLGHDRRIPYARRIGSAAVISVVVPVHDEERTVALLYEELDSALQPLGQPWEAVFVDDGSGDGSFSALTRLHDAKDNVRVIRLRRNFGKATALSTGFAHAEGDIVVTIDADLQDDPTEIPRLLAKLDEGFDLVTGWKTHRRDPLSRRIPSKVFNWVTGRVSGLRLHDLNCGLKAYRAEVVRGLRLYGELHRFIPVLAHYRGHRIAELPVNHRAREHGRSRYGVERYLRGFLDLLTVSFIGRYRYRPLHLFGGLGLLLGVVGFAVLVYLTILKLDGHAIGQRPLLILGVLLVVVGLQFFSLGLISELITSQHEERADTRERMELHVDEILS
jgi:glycosyltransferase involved in cell wall biosynthesis